MGATRYELWVNHVGARQKIIYEPAIVSNSFTPVTPLPNGTFHAWVRPLAADGEPGLWSQRLIFQMDYRVGPVTMTPQGITTDRTPEFLWQAVDGAVEYELWVNNVTTGQSKVIYQFVPHVQGADEISWTQPTELNTSDYRWWVRAIGPDGYKTAWSTATDFHVPVPAIITPRGGISTNLPRFSWSGVNEYVSYDLWVDNLTTGEKQVLRKINVADRFYQTVLPFENGTFRAWVRAFDADGNVSQWSGSADFTISTGVGNAPTLVSPGGFATSRPTFLWTGGSNATSFEILVKDMSQASQPVVLNVRDIALRNYTASVDLAPGRTYRWWVRGLDQAGNGLPWSQPLNFRVVSADQPTAPAADFTLPALAEQQSIDVAWTGGFEDGVVSISAHPAGVVVQIDPQLLTAGASLESGDTNLLLVDNVMEALLADELTSEKTADAGTLAEVITSTEDVPTSSNRKLSTAAWSLLAGTVLARRNGKRSDKRGT